MDSAQLPCERHTACHRTARFHARRRTGRRGARSPQNAGVGGYEPRRIATEDGHAHVLAINVLAPYLLTAWMHRPRRIVVVTSGMQHGAGTDLSDVDWTRRRWDGLQAYSDSKLFDATLAAAIARHWPQVIATSASPGWVATNMGGAGAPDDLEAGSLTQAWLATSENALAKCTGAMYYHQEPIRSSGGAGARALHPAVTSKSFQDELLRRGVAGADALEDVRQG